jgi:hypothetical protein
MEAVYRQEDANEDLPEQWACVPYIPKLSTVRLVDPLALA